MHFALNKAITTADAIVSEKAVDLGAKIYEKNDDCRVWVTSQVLDKLKTSLSNEQGQRLEGFVNEEKTTKGVATFTPETSIQNSAEALSRKGVVLVIVDESEMQSTNTDKRTAVLTPSEFIRKYETACNIYDNLPYEKHFIDLLLLSVFNDKITQQITSKIEKK